MIASGQSMVEIRGGPPPTAEIELERATVTAEQVRRFVDSAMSGVAGARAATSVPLTFALAMRRGHGPEASISADAFAIHGGHDIVSHAPIALNQTYVVSGRIERVFAKTGRSGPLTIVERRVRIRDSTGQVATEIVDRQVVRWRPGAGEAAALARPAPSQPQLTDNMVQTVEPTVAAPHLDVGDALRPYRRRGPTAQEISSWAAALRDREVLFHDRADAVALGYRDLVVPGPMQSAFVDQWLGAVAARWRPTRLHMTFRQSLLAGESMLIEGVVIDREGDECNLDITIKNAASAEMTSTGTAVLRRSG